jgi:hypothetical protein
MLEKITAQSQSAAADGPKLGDDAFWEVGRTVFFHKHP